MSMDYWQKQTRDEPLFEDILWSRPETKQGAGKLLVVGGNSHGFAAAQEAYAGAEAAKIGHIRLLLPDALKKTVGVLGPYDYAPSTPSGSFGRESLNELLSGAAWADAVLLAGDFGRNSETAILFESFAAAYTGPLVVTGDAIDYFISIPQIVRSRPNLTLVLGLSQLQRLGTSLKFEVPFISTMGLMLLAHGLHEFSQNYPFCLVTKELNNLIVAHGGRVSSTKVDNAGTAWRVKTAAGAAVFWLQNQNRPFEAISSSIID